MCEFGVRFCSAVNNGSKPTSAVPNGEPKQTSHAGDGGLGKVELVGALLARRLLDELRVVREGLGQEDAALAREEDEEHRECADDDDDAEVDEALVEEVLAECNAA